MKYKTITSIFTTFAFLSVSSMLNAAENDRLMYGMDIANANAVKSETKITPKNVSNLRVKWVYTAGGNTGSIACPPALVDGVLYFPDWIGNLHAVDAKTGKQIWMKSLPKDFSVPGMYFPFSRNTPAVYGDLIILGNQTHNFKGGKIRKLSDLPNDGGILIAINRKTGELVWRTKIEDHPLAQITQNPVVYKDKVYVGVSSWEEFLEGSEDFTFPSFRGSVVALDAKTGTMAWKTYTCPGEADIKDRKKDDYTGNAVWGGMPSIDPVRNLVYVGTGNNYTVPEPVQKCINEWRNSPEPKKKPACDTENNYTDAIVAMDLDTGKVKWANKLSASDVWTLACLPEKSRSNMGFKLDVACPDPKSEDTDFGEAPVLMTIDHKGKKRDVGIAMQKSGIVYALDRDTGEIVWSKKAGPNTNRGGAAFGSGTDGVNIYTKTGNNLTGGNIAGPIEWTLVKPTPDSPPKTDKSVWSALNAATGDIVWQREDISPTLRSSVTLVNGIVFGGSSTPGAFQAFDAKSGKLLWSFSPGAEVGTTATVSDGIVYWGSGYARDANVAKGPFMLWAFEVVP
jgi:polyvinyl alcohol dehydrogenase (cytochrome)